jgi:hypothetical protein
MQPPDEQTELTAEEQALLARLREVPAGPLRTSLVELLMDLAAFAREPSCAAAQADGVPCDSVHSTCDRCRDAVAVLDEIDSALAGVLGFGLREQRKAARAQETRPT